jgi:hypothetical protein
MATTALSWTVTLQTTEGRRPSLKEVLPGGPRRKDVERRNLGVSLCPVTGAITRMWKGVFDNLNREKPGSIELGDRIVEVEGKTGQAHDLLSAWLVDGKLKANIRVKLVRSLLLQPVVVQMQPGRPLGIDIALDGSNIITDLCADGLVAELNKVHPNTIEAGDKIVAVDGKKTDNAVEQIRAWVKSNQGKAGDLPLTVARRAFSFKQMLLNGDFKEMSEPNSALRKPNSAWRFSVPVRLKPGQSLGLNLCLDNNAIADIDEEGAAADMNKGYPGSLRVGDRVLAVDCAPCPCKDSVAELECWFKRTLGDKDKERSVRLTVLRPVEWGAGMGGVAVLPPCDGTLAEVEKEDKAEVESSGSTSTAVSRSVSLRDNQLCTEACGKALKDLRELHVAFESSGEELCVDDLRQRGRRTEAWAR